MSMRRRRVGGRGAWAAGLLPLVVLCTGCPVSTPVGNNDVIDTGENSSLTTAEALNLAEHADQRQISGTITGGSDIDVYALGSLAVGDHVVVDVQRTSGNLDAVAAIFDSQAELIAFNDDRTPDSSDLNPLLDFVLPGDPGDFFLAIIAYPGNNTTGGYTADVRVERNVGVTPPSGQVVFLNWAGGQDVVVANVGTFNLPPFSADDVGLPASQTVALKDRVETIVRSRYAGFDMTVLSSDDTPVPSAPHSTVYFGGRNFQAFAISEEVDGFNRNPSDNTIIFTESFIDAFSVSPTFEQMAQALGNTVAHEVGHLVGLVHTKDCNDLMDTTCTNDRLLVPQDFSTAPLDDSVFPFGLQNAPELLAWILGL